MHFYQNIKSTFQEIKKATGFPAAFTIILVSISKLLPQFV